MTVFIYCLSDPETGEIRYVGKTKDKANRFRNHLKEKRRGWKSAWVQSLKNRGLEPVMEELERIENSDDTDWQHIEKFYISYFKFLGLNLTNLKEGGTGCSTPKASWKQTPEHRAKIGAANRGRKKPKRTGLAVAEANRRRVFSDEQRKKLSDTRKNNPKIQEAVRKMSMNNIGSKRSVESRLKISKALKGRAWTPEHRAKAFAARLEAVALRMLRKKLTGFSNC